MDYIGYGVYLIPEIKYFHIIRAYLLGEKANKEKKLIPKFSYLKRMVSLLTNVKRPKFYHVFLLNRILKAADLVGERKEEHQDKDPIELVNQVISKIAGILNKTQDELIERCTPKQLEDLFNEYQKNKYIDEIEREKTLIRAFMYGQAIKEGVVTKRLEDLSKSQDKIRNNNLLENKVNKKIESNIEKEGNVFHFQFKH